MSSVTLELVLFRSAEALCAIEARHVLGLRRAPQILEEASVQTMENLLGLPCVAHRAPQWIELRGGDEVHTIVTDGPLELLSLDITAISPLPRLIQSARETNCLSALAFDGGRLFSLFTPDSIRKNS